MDKNLYRRALLLGAALGLTFLVLGAYGCAESPVTEAPAGADLPGWMVKKADPGREGRCGCAVPDTRTIWMARTPVCDLTTTEPHEKCHARARMAGVMDWRKDGCHDKFKPQRGLWR